MTESLRPTFLFFTVLGTFKQATISVHQIITIPEQVISVVSKIVKKVIFGVYLSILSYWPIFRRVQRT